MANTIKVSINGVTIEGLTIDGAIQVASKLGGKEKKIKTNTPGMFEAPELEKVEKKGGRKKGNKYAMWNTKSLRTLILNKHLTPTKLLEFPIIANGRNRGAVANMVGKVRSGEEQIMGQKAWKVYKAIIIDKQEPNDDDDSNSK